MWLCAHTTKASIRDENPKPMGACVNHYLWIQTLPPRGPGGWYLPLITCPKSSSGVSPKKGTQPTRNSYRIMPMAHQSTGFP